MAGGFATQQSVSPDGQLAVFPVTVYSPTVDDTEIWNISDPAHPVPESALPPAWTQASFIGRRTLMTADSGNTRVQLWNLANPRAPAVLRLPQACQLTTAIQCGSTFIVDDAGSPVLLWDATDPRDARPAGHLDEPGNPFANTGFQSALAVLSGNDDCLLAEAANSNNTNSVEVWAARNPSAPGLVATMQTAGQVLATAVSDDGTRVAALVQPPASQSSSPNTLDVWSVSRSGNTSQLAAVPVSTEMEDAEFVPHSHLIPFNPPTTDEILPDILDPDPAASYRSLCSTSQNVLTRKTWQHYAPGFPYESPC